MPGCRPPDKAAGLFDHFQGKEPASPEAGATRTPSSLRVIQSAVSGTHQPLTLGIEELPRRPVEFQRDMGTTIEVGAYRSAVPHHKGRRDLSANPDLEANSRA